MRSLKKNIWIAGALLLIILSGFQVKAQTCRGYGPQHHNGNGTGRMHHEGSGGLNRMQLHLELSDEQLDQIKELHLNLQKEILPVKNKIREKWAQLHTLITENGNATQIDRLIEEIGNLQVSIDKQKVRTHLKVRELLTDEQKIKFDASPGLRFMLDDQFHFGPGMRHGSEW